MLDRLLEGSRREVRRWAATHVLISLENLREACASPLLVQMTRAGD